MKFRISNAAKFDPSEGDPPMPPSSAPFFWFGSSLAIVAFFTAWFCGDWRLLVHLLPIVQLGPEPSFPFSTGIFIAGCLIALLSPKRSVTTALTGGTTAVAGYVGVIVFGLVSLLIMFVIGNRW